MITTVTAKTSDLPVTLAEAKDHLRVTGDDLDTYIQSLIEAATEYCESTTGRSMRVAQTLTQSYCGWPKSPVRFDRQPVSAISTVKYYADGAAVLSTLASTNYRLHASSNAAAHLEFDDDFSAPSLDARDDAVIITYTAGYADIASVPNTAKHAVKLKLSDLFGALDPREAEVNLKRLDDMLGQLNPGTYR